MPVTGEAHGPVTGEGRNLLYVKGMYQSQVCTYDRCVTAVTGEEGAPVTGEGHVHVTGEGSIHITSEGHVNLS